MTKRLRGTSQLRANYMQIYFATRRKHCYVYDLKILDLRAAPFDHVVSVSKTKCYDTSGVMLLRPLCNVRTGIPILRKTVYKEGISLRLLTDFVRCYEVVMAFPFTKE